MDQNCIRQPAVAGQFYPASEKRLRATVQEALAGTPENLPSGRVRVLLVPHAGYSFSGQVAGKAYSLLRESAGEYDQAVVLAPAHTLPFQGVALSDRTAWRTPLGDVETAMEECQRLTQNSSLFTFKEVAHSREHALEVQLPFLQTILPEARLIPMVCGNLTQRDMIEAADVLRNELWQPRTLWILSTDFTHYGRAFGYLPFRNNIAENLEKLDMKAVELIQRQDGAGFLDYIERTGATICGQTAIALLLFCLQKVKEPVHAKLLDYNTSGAVTGDYSHTVSYVSMACMRKLN